MWSTTGHFSTFNLQNSSINNQYVYGHHGQEASNWVHIGSLSSSAKGPNLPTDLSPPYLLCL